MMLRRILLLLIGLGLVLTSSLTVAKDQLQEVILPFADAQIRICDDGGQWPPYTYLSWQDGAPTPDVVGFSVDIIDEILTGADIGYTIRLLPWRRCLQSVLIGEQDMLLNASYSPERAKRYHLSPAIYQTQDGVFFRRNEGHEQQNWHLAHLVKQRICGINGYNYSYLNIPSNQIDKTSNSFSALAHKLLDNHCDVFVNPIEPVLGMRQVGWDILADGRINYQPLVDVPPTDFYMIISRQSPYGEALHQLVDAQIVAMQENGRMAELWAPYLRDYTPG